MSCELSQKLQERFEKSNTCAPSMKNGRFSGKNVSNADRLSTAGSTSTCPKSGLNVASSVRFDVSRSLRSRPARNEGRPRRLNGSLGIDANDDDLLTTYGNSSRPDVEEGMRSPSRWPKRCGPPDSVFPHHDH